MWIFATALLLLSAVVQIGGSGLLIGERHCGQWKRSLHADSFLSPWQRKSSSFPPSLDFPRFSFCR